MPDQNCPNCYHLWRLHDEMGCRAERFGWRGEREEYCGCPCRETSRV